MVKACETGVSGLQAGLCPARTPVTVEGRSEGSASQTNNVPLDVLSILQHWLVVVTFSVWVTRPPVIFAALITTLQARVSYRVSLFLRSSSKSISFYGSPSLIIVVSLTTVRCDCSAPNTRICTSQRVSDRQWIETRPGFDLTPSSPLSRRPCRLKKIRSVCRETFCTEADRVKFTL